jgi:dynein light chain LC8-type
MSDSSSSANNAAGGQGETKVHGAVVSLPVDMDAEMLRDAIDTAQAALAGVVTEADWRQRGDDVVASIKGAFDKKYGPTWHCVIGKNFGTKVTHESGRYCFFRLGVSRRGRFCGSYTAPRLQVLSCPRLHRCHDHLHRIVSFLRTCAGALRAALQERVAREAGMKEKRGCHNLRLKNEHAFRKCFNSPRLSSG